MPIASEDSSGRSLDEVVSVPANFYDYSGACQLLTNGILDQDVVADDKRGKWWSSSFDRLARFSSVSAAFCHSGANERRWAGRKSRTGWLNTNCAGEAPPERGVLRKSKILFANFASSKAPDVHEPRMRVFMEAPEFCRAKLGPIVGPEGDGGSYTGEKVTDVTDDSASGGFGVAKCDHVRPTTKTVNYDEEMTAVDFT
ncbi:hypothetical protein OUZ56_009627 [Daphnia magna]|uniref:Uncharacterized protein n=1 Tax=Daphnia magna TaxID=35525 RepID=A0ABR0AGJ0_9CRUS|nr:hypothetical protein OUZ56_009627 [Daphnia magna]